MDTPRPSNEDYEWMRLEHLQECTNNVARKRSDNQSEGKFEQSLTDKKKNSNVFSTEQQKESNYLQEAQWIKGNCN